MAGFSEQGQVLVVHCVDTEGPIGGDVRRRPDGSKEFMDNWADIKASLHELTCDDFRNKNTDSSGNPYVYNWFIMDHYGFENNPRGRTLGIHKIWNKYEKFYKKIKIKDNFYFHHHPLSFSKSTLHCSTHFFNNQSIIYEILNRKLVDKLWFPSVFRPGFHTIRPDSHWFLEQFIPFDYSNQSVFDNKNRKIFRLRRELILNSSQKNI